MDNAGNVQPEMRSGGELQATPGSDNTNAATVIATGDNAANTGSIASNTAMSDSNSMTVEKDSALAKEAQAISDYASSLRSGENAKNPKSLEEISARSQALMAQYQLDKALETDNSLEQGRAVAAGVGYARQALKNIGLYPPTAEESKKSYEDVIAQARMMAKGTQLNNVQKSDLLVSAKTLIEEATVSVSNYQPAVTEFSEDDS